MSDATFPKQARLLASRQFRRVFDRRVSVADEVLIVYGCENDLESCRLGLAVSRKIGNAVVRNRWKRLIREAFRLHRDDRSVSMDLVVLPRRAARPTASAVAHSLTSLWPRLSKRLAKAAR